MYCTVLNRNVRYYSALHCTVFCAVHSTQYSTVHFTELLSLLDWTLCLGTCLNCLTADSDRMKQEEPDNLELTEKYEN